MFSYLSLYATEKSVSKVGGVEGIEEGQALMLILSGTANDSIQEIRE
jgi:hypothetical protein